jgi:hypothetical protein
LLQATVAEVITDGGAPILEEYLDSDEELPDLDAEPAEPAEHADPVEYRWKKARDEWEWEKKPRSFESKGNAIFPEANYTRFKGLSPLDLFDLIFDKDLLEIIATKSKEYSVAMFGNLVNITAEEIKTFLAILLLSGYNKVTDFKLYWSNSEDTKNTLVKAPMSRNRFLLVKRCFHLGQDTELENDRSVFQHC